MTSSHSYLGLISKHYATAIISNTKSTLPQKQSQDTSEQANKAYRLFGEKTSTSVPRRWDLTLSNQAITQSSKPCYRITKRGMHKRLRNANQSHIKSEQRYSMQPPFLLNITQVAPCTRPSLTGQHWVPSRGVGSPTTGKLILPSSNQFP